MKPRLIACLMSLCVGIPLSSAAPIEVQQRSKWETSPSGGRYHTVIEPATLEGKETAIVVCDMWDKHWCPDATKRVAEMAPRMNEVLKAARAKGALIIHCPSDTMEFYKDTPQRKLAQAAPVIQTSPLLEPWCRIDRVRENALPIDDSDGGCDTPTKNYRAWSRQIATLEIAENDAVTDSAEAFYLMKQRGIKNVIVMGVHTNMCVLGRPFGIRQLIRQRMHVLLMRDMTDTMYNPGKSPNVSHFTGTDLVVEHIEKFWCPTITSADFLGGKEFRFKGDDRPTLVMMIGEDEYVTNRTLPDFAARELGKSFRVLTIFSNDQKPNEFPGIGLIQQADVLLVSVRRRMLPTAQLELVRKHIAAGKPVVGIRTASHAFELPRDGKLADGQGEWAKFDIDVLGCDYTGHHGAKLATYAGIAPDAKHPILTGVPAEPFKVGTSLYKSLPLHPQANVLLMGWAEGVEKKEPVAWTFTRADGGKTFYTSLGGLADFGDTRFRRLLSNGIHWAAGLPIPPEK